MKRILSTVLLLLLLLHLLPGKISAVSSQRYAGAVTTASNSLNVRSNPTTASSIVSALKKGSYITLLEKSGSWWKVEYAKNRYGYCHSDYITPVQGTPTSVQVSGALNVRSGPGTTYNPITTLPAEEPVLLLTTSGEWSRILYHGVKTGYVSSRYLSTSQQTPASIKLSVPNFKQTDSRWGSVQIGNSGKTMAKIGCATTAIAMMESYRTGTTITPDAMMKKLNYTSSGSVYWPSYYTVVTQKTNYLSNILSLLQQGKPVLFGAKNTYGSQHWVVITGYTGSGTTAASFTINDPGSNSRTTLQQFLNAYPTFYKYFHY